MTQVITYWVEDNGENKISEDEWAEIECLQRRTNLRQYFHKGRVGFLRFTYEPRWPQLFSDSMLPLTMSIAEVERYLQSLIDRGWTWEDLVHANLAARFPGGIYSGDFLLAGRSEVSDLASDVNLVIRFLVKASMMAPSCSIHVSIDGDSKVPDLIISHGRIEPDHRAVADQLEEHRKRGDFKAAEELFDAVSSHDLLGPVKSPVFAKEGS